MEQVEERYISLLTDFGFKRIFGSAKLCDKVFDRLFEEAEIAKFSPLEMREYEASKKAYRDIKNSVDTAKREGIAEGMEKGMKQGMEKGMKQGMKQGMEKGMKQGMEKGMKQGMKQGMEKGMKQGMEKGLEQRSLEIARKMLAKGMDAASVMEITGLSAEQMQQLKAEF